MSKVIVSSLVVLVSTSVSWADDIFPDTLASDLRLYTGHCAGFCENWKPTNVAVKQTHQIAPPKKMNKAAAARQ